MLPQLQILDGVLPQDELAMWQHRVQTGQQSTGLTESDVQGTQLYGMASTLAEGLPLIHCLLFEIVEGHDTELHQDIGEYCVLFYPYTNMSAPLRIERSGLIEDVEVRANRLVLLNCTEVRHQQVVALDGSARYSVAFKFRLPVDTQLREVGLEPTTFGL